MTKFYFDVETTGFDPKVDKIITIQYWQLDDKNAPVGDLTILKEWESSEENFGFIPVGFNLPFEFRFLSHKFSEYGEHVDPFKIIHDKPHLDLKTK